MKKILLLAFCFTSLTGVASEPSARIILSPRTNLVLPCSNIGLEAPVGSRMSFGGDIYFPWFGYSSDNRNCIQSAAADVELRLWLAPQKVGECKGNTFTGWSIAIGALAGQFDLEYDFKGRQGILFGGYADISYSFFLREHLRLTLCLGGGYTRIVSAGYKVFSPSGILIRDKRYLNDLAAWYGPSKISVSLSFPIIKRCRQ